MTGVNKKQQSKITLLGANDVVRVAKLANLPISPNQNYNQNLSMYMAQLSYTLSFVSELQELDTKNVAPTSQVTGKTNELREDETTPCLSQKDALKNAKDTHNGFFMSKITWE